MSTNRRQDKTSHSQSMECWPTLFRRCNERPRKSKRSRAPQLLKLPLTFVVVFGEWGNVCVSFLLLFSVAVAKPKMFRLARPPFNGLARVNLLLILRCHQHQPSSVALLHFITFKILGSLVGSAFESFAWKVAYVYLLATIDFYHVLWIEVVVIVYRTYHMRECLQLSARVLSMLKPNG